MARRRRSFGIGGKIAVLLSALVVISTSLVGIGTYQRLHESLVQKELAALRDEVNAARGRFASQVALLREDVSYIAGTPPVQALFRAQSASVPGRPNDLRLRAQWLSSALLRAKHQYTRLRVVAADGRELVRAEKANGAVRVVPGEESGCSDDRWFREGLRASAGVSVWALDAGGRSPPEGVFEFAAVGAAAPIRGENGDAAGLVLLELELDPLLETLEGNRSERHGLYAVNERGSVLFSSEHDGTGASSGRRGGNTIAALLRDCDWQARTAKAFVRSDETGRWIAAGIERFVLDSARPEQSIAFVKVVPYSEVIAGSVAARNRCLLFGIVSLIAAVVIGLLFAKSLTRPLRQISRAVEAFGRGDRHAALPLQAADEPGMLARAFHEMINQVRQRDDRRFRQLVETAPDAVVVVDGTGTVILCNETASNVFGYTREELLDAPLEMLIPLDSREAHREHFERYMSAPYVRPMMFGSELSGLRKDGSDFPAEISLSPLETEEGTLVLAAVRDISQRKQTEHTLRDIEAQLRQSQKLEAVGSLAGGVAHEFNNLLQAIQGYAKYAMEGLPEEDRRYQDLVQVEKAAKRAATLTRQLLGFGRRQVMERVSVDVNEMVGDLQKMLRPLIGEHIDVTFKLARGVGHVHGDPAMLQQVLLNLCVNARDAMPGGGRLEITTEAVTAPDAQGKIPCGLQAGSCVRLTVADSGTGMAAEVKDHIFEPFFTTKEVGKGTGLGLAMVYGIVKEHHGDIVVESEPGQGTVFELYLPTTDEQDATAQQASPRAVQSGTETVLLAEDEPMVREFTVRVLQEAGYKTVTASDGAEAVAAFEENAETIALVILDVVMPHLSGWEVREQIRAKRPELPVLLCTGYDPKTAQADQALDEEVQLLQKPFDRETLLCAVREALDARAVSLAGATA